MLDENWTKQQTSLFSTILPDKKYSIYLAFTICWSPNSSILVNPSRRLNSVISGHFQIRYTCKRYIYSDTRSNHISTKVTIHATVIYSQTSNPKHKVPNRNLNISLIVALIPQAGIHPSLLGRNLLTWPLVNPHSLFLPSTWAKTWVRYVCGPYFTNILRWYHIQ